MKKLSGLERGILLLTLLFFLFTAGFFLYENRARDLTRVEVERLVSQEPPQPEEEPAPGILDNERINVNLASEADLTRLPGIGEVKAKNIVEYRAAHGPFQRPEDLQKVSGIGEVTLAGLLDYITLEETEGGAVNAKNTGGG